MGASTPQIMAQAVAVAIDAVAGKGHASITRGSDGIYTVAPSSDQIVPLRRIVGKTAAYAAAGEPTIRVSLYSVFAPIVLRKAAPWVLAGASLFFAAGYFTHAKKA
jgi:hypothetical protein